MGNKFHFHISAPVKEQIICLLKYIYITKVASTNDPSSRLILPAVRDNPVGTVSVEDLDISPLTLPP